VVVFASAAAAPETAPSTASKRPLVLQQWRPSVSATSGFYEDFVAPQMSILYRDETAAAAATPSNPSSNRATQDPAVRERVGKRAVRAFDGGLKRYAIERLGIDGWSFPMLGRHDGSALPNDTRGARLNLGFSSLARRADLLIPVSSGRVVVSRDVRGRFATTFQAASSKCRLAATVDVRERRAAVGLGLQF